MVCNGNSNFKNEGRVDNNSLRSNNNIHTIGLNYICNLLERAGFAILNVNPDPNHHIQLVSKIKERSLLIAVRSAYAPKVGTIDTSTLEKLVRESKELNATPYFAGLTIISPTRTDDIEGESLKDQEHKVIFYGMTAVDNVEVLADE